MNQKLADWKNKHTNYVVQRFQEVFWNHNMGQSNYKSINHGKYIRLGSSNIYCKYDLITPRKINSQKWWKLQKTKTKCFLFIHQNSPTFNQNADHALISNYFRGINILKTSKWVSRYCVKNSCKSSLTDQVIKKLLYLFRVFN